MKKGSNWIYWTFGIITVIGGVGAFLYFRARNRQNKSISQPNSTNQGQPVKDNKGVVETIIDGAKDVITSISDKQQPPKISREGKKQNGGYHPIAIIIAIGNKHQEIVKKYFPNWGWYDDTKLTNGEEIATWVELAPIDGKQYTIYRKQKSPSEKSIPSKWGNLSYYPCGIGVRNKKKIDEIAVFYLSDLLLFSDSINEKEYLQNPSTAVALSILNKDKSPLSEIEINNFWVASVKELHSWMNTTENVNSQLNNDLLDLNLSLYYDTIAKAVKQAVATQGTSSFDGNFEFMGRKKRMNLLDTNL